MGREIRMVPANWEHPMLKPENDRYGHGGYQPMYNSKFSESFEEWLADFDRVRSGDLDQFEKKVYPRGLADWIQEETPPNPDYYLPDDIGETTWFQLYETVSEGTPVSPPFSTKQELADYLAEHGDYWDQKRCREPSWKELWGGEFGVSGWGKERAEAFVNAGLAPSMIVTNGKAEDGKFAFPRTCN